MKPLRAKVSDMRDSITGKERTMGERFAPRLWRALMHHDAELRRIPHYRPIAKLVLPAFHITVWGPGDTLRANWGRGVGR